MSTNTQYIVQKLWNYCNILRDDGMSYSEMQMNRASRHQAFLRI